MLSSSSAPRTSKKRPQPEAAWVGFLKAKVEAGQPEADVLWGGSGHAVLERIRGLQALVLRHPLES